MENANANGNVNPAIKEKIVPGIAKILAYTVESSETDVDDKVFDELKSAFDEIKAKKDTVDASDVLEGLFDVADGVTDLTPTPIDDTVVNVAKGAVEFGGLKDKITNWVSGWFN